MRTGERSTALTEKIDRGIDRFFGEELLPLGARLRSGGAGLLVTHLETDASSYFVKRASAGMTKIDFEAGGCASPETVEADLARAWNRGDAGCLVALAPGIARLARTLRQTERESSEVSEFVYAMY